MNTQKKPVEIILDPSELISWQVEFNQRIKAFAQAVNINESKVREILESLGVDGKSEQSLTILDSDEFLPMSDLMSAFVDSNLTKKALLRCGMPHLRGKTHLPENGHNVVDAVREVVSAFRPKTDWSDRELLERYSDTEPDISKILRERTHGRPFAIFNSDGNLNLDESLELLKIAKRQATNDKHIVNGQLVMVRRAGEFPFRMVDESPLCPGIALVKSICGETGTDWNNIDSVMRVMCRIQVTLEKNLNKTDLRAIYKTAKAMDFNGFRIEYPDAAIEYDRLANLDQLPKLKINPNQASAKIDKGI